MDTSRSLGLLAAAVFGVGAGGCLDNGLKPEARDTTPPSVQVVTPQDTLYDTDGDRLLDLELTWSDSAGAVDWASVRVRSLGGVNGPADSSTNLLDVWRVERRDTLGLVVHETLGNLLHGGSNQLEITLPDTAGNLRVDTIAFTLPHGAFVKTIVTGLGLGAIPANDVTVCPDDGRLYMTANRNIVVVDPDSLRAIGIVRDPEAGDDLAKALCVPGDAVLYVTQRVERFDRPSMSWLARISGSFGSIGIVQSRADQNVLYVGESIDGTIGIIDRAQGARTGQLLPFSSQFEYVFDLAVLDGDAKLFATRLAEGGILVIDPQRDSVLGKIRVGDAAWPGPGRTDAITLSRDGQRLYAAVIEGLYRGVVEIDTRADSVVRVLPLFDYFCIDLALSPSERRMFVTTQDNGSPSENVLVDMTNWDVLETFPRPRIPAVTRFDQAVVFHPNGKLIFVAHNLDLDVYLSRET
ncbi:MAG: YncE family protein [Gemmatimonadales bacterium]